MGIFFAVKNRIVYRNKCVLMLQKVVRGHLARRAHRPRITGVRKIRALRANLAQLENIARQLKSDSESVLRNVQEIGVVIDKAIDHIKATSKISAAEIDALYEKMLAHVNKQSAALNVKLQEQKNAEEQERLRQIQLALETERKAKEEEERRKQEEEENRKKCVPIGHR